MENRSRYLGLLVFFLFLISANLLLLDLKIFVPNSGFKISDIATVVTTTPMPISQPANKDFLSCPANCISLIKEATAATSAVGGPKETAVLETTSKIALSKEYYVPLGSGSTTKSDWENIVATETVIAPSNYGNIKEAYFIASLRNPTLNGQVEAELYNVTSGHPVWGSHVIMNGPSSQTITSGKIVLDNGNKLYRVRLKSTMSYLAYLDNAKIRIITE